MIDCLDFSMIDFDYYINVPTRLLSLLLVMIACVGFLF